MPQVRRPKAINQAKLRGKRVLIRVDFNVPMHGEKILDDFRITQSLPTLSYIIGRGGVPIILSHREPVKSMQPIKRHIEKMLRRKVEFFENLRFQKGELENDKKFARSLAKFGDLYVNEAFSVSHREHASIVGIPKFLPAYMGLLFEREWKVLSKVRIPPHPFIFILGGMKFDTKVGMLNHFQRRAETIFIGGAIANTFLAAHNISVGKSVIEEYAVSHILKKFPNGKIMLPQDVIVGRGKVRIVTEVKKNEQIYDIGPQSLEALYPRLKKAKMILWNGPLGNTDKGYIESTKTLLTMLSGIRARVVIGGGDTHIVVRGMKLGHNFYHVSTAGGAMLDFLATGSLPGIEALICREQ